MVCLMLSNSPKKLNMDPGLFVCEVLKECLNTRELYIFNDSSIILQAVNNTEPVVL